MKQAQAFAPQIPPPYTHQEESIAFMETRERCYDASDPGTGKTRSALETFAKRRRNGGKKALILAPKSILEPSWASDAKKFTPQLKVSVAYASNRKRAFAADADIYITNHDAVKWIADNLDFSQYDTLIIDEITAYKHRSSQRSKAVAKIRSHFEYRLGMSGTPTPNSILDIWHQMLLIDDGERLGDNFYRFRNVVCSPLPTKFGITEWTEKEGSQEAVADLVSDITIRHKFEDCVSIPEHSVHYVNFDLDDSHMADYLELKKEAILETKDSVISAINAGSLAQKLLQVSSGAVYNVEGEGKYSLLSTKRYELVIELAEQRDHTLIAFNWTHEKEELSRLAKQHKLSFAIIDGTTPDKERTEIINKFQAGKLRILFAHPATASHGLTLTTGSATIWPSPTHNAERFIQFNKRIPRAGQTKKTETILVAANDTLDQGVYARTDGKLLRMNDLLNILEEDIK